MVTFSGYSYISLNTCGSNNERVGERNLCHKSLLGIYFVLLGFCKSRKKYRNLVIRVVIRFLVTHKNDRRLNIKFFLEKENSAILRVREVIKAKIWRHHNLRQKNHAFPSFGKWSTLWIKIDYYLMKTFFILPCCA